METEFEFITGYENLYKINKCGEIWSCFYGRIMKPQTTSDGYLWVKLRKECITYKGRIHRLLGLQYLENPDNLPEIDHIDRNKLNNNLENLRWVSRQTNRINRPDCLIHKTEEELKIRTDNIREYKKLKAREYSKTYTEPIILTEEEIELKKQAQKEKRKLKARDRRANLTEEEHAKILAQKRAHYANGGTERQQEYLKNNKTINNHINTN